MDGNESEQTECSREPIHVNNGAPEDSPITIALTGTTQPEGDKVGDMALNCEAAAGQTDQTTTSSSSDGHVGSRRHTTSLETPLDYQIRSTQESFRLQLLDLGPMETSTGEDDYGQTLPQAGCAPRWVRFDSTRLKDDDSDVVIPEDERCLVLKKPTSSAQQMFTIPVRDELDELYQVRQWANHLPLPKISLEMMHGVGCGRHGNRNTNHRATDWMLMLAIYFSVAFFIFSSLYFENLRWTCTFPCGGECSKVDAIPEGGLGQHVPGCLNPVLNGSRGFGNVQYANATPTATAERGQLLFRYGEGELAVDQYNFDLVIGLLLREVSCVLSVRIEVTKPSGDVFTWSGETSQCEYFDDHCFLLAFGGKIGSDTGNYRATVWVDEPCGGSVHVAAFTARRWWVITEGVFRSVLLIVALVVFVWVVKKLYESHRGEETYLGVRRILLLFPFLILFINPIFFLFLYRRHHKGGEGYFYAILEHLVPNLCSDFLCTYILSLLSNTYQVKVHPTVLDITVNEVVLHGSGDNRVSVWTDLRREEIKILSYRDACRAFDSMLATRGSEWSGLLSKEDIEECIRSDRSLANFLSAEKIVWEHVVQKMRTESEKGRKPRRRRSRTSVFDILKEDVADTPAEDGVSRAEFASCWVHALNEASAEEHRPSDWIAPISKAFNNYQFNISSLVASDQDMQAPLEVRFVIESSTTKYITYISIPADVLRSSLIRSVALPRPVFSSSDVVADLFLCINVAALVILRQTACPTIAIEVNGWQPKEISYTSMWDYVTQSKMGTILLFVTLPIIAADCYRFSERGGYHEGRVSGPTWAWIIHARQEDSIQAASMLTVVVACAVLVGRGWQNLKFLPYHHSRHRHLIFQGVTGLVVLIVLSIVFVLVFHPNRHVDTFRGLWDDLGRLVLVTGVTLCLAVALSPPRPVRTMPCDVDWHTFPRFLEDTGGRKTRSFRLLRDKRNFDRWMQRVSASDPYALSHHSSQSPSSRQSSPCPSPIPTDSEEDSVHLSGQRRQHKDQYFCTETALLCWHAATLVYEPVLRPTAPSPPPSKLELQRTSTICFDDPDVPIDIGLTDPRGRWGPLGTYYPVPIFVKGHRWASLEHYWQAMKFIKTDPSYAQRIAQAETAAKANQLGQSRPVRKEVWTNQKEDIMREGVLCKFQQNAACRDVLLQTGDRWIRCSDEKDDFFGWSETRGGQNKMGLILMDTRRQVRQIHFLEDRLRRQRFGCFDYDEDDEALLESIGEQLNRDPTAKNLLMQTGDKTLVNWSDVDEVWGVGLNGTGQNKYCTLLMKLREQWARDLTKETTALPAVVRSFDWYFKHCIHIDRVIPQKTWRTTQSRQRREEIDVPEANPGHETSPTFPPDHGTEEKDGKAHLHETKVAILSTHAINIDPPMYMVAFRGTVVFEDGSFDWRNVKTDCQCLKERMDIGNGKTAGVHQGFHRLWKTLRDSVIKEIVSVVPDTDDGKTLVITGHSLGGALATLCAFELATKVYKKRPVSMYNFGSPRVGDTAFAEAYDRAVPDSFRVVCKGDPITMMPPMIGYTHVGNSVLMNSLGEFLVNAGFAERRILPYFNSLQHVRLLDSHRRGDTGVEPGYVRGLAQMASRFNLRTHGELAYKMQLGAKYSPEWSRLWAACASQAPEEYDLVFLREALAFCGEPPPVPQTVPLKLFRCDLRQNHLAAATADTQQWAVSHGYQYVTTIGEVFTFPRGDGRSWQHGDMRPIYLFYDSKRMDHLLCASKPMLDFATGNGYDTIRIEGYVVPRKHRPSRWYLPTVPLTVTWNAHRLDHKTDILKRQPDEGFETNPALWEDNVAVGVDCYIAERGTGSKKVTRLWAMLGQVPVQLILALVFCSSGDPQKGARLAMYTMAGVMGIGYLYSRLALIITYPRNIDLAACASYGAVLVTTEFSRLGTDDLMLWTPAMLLCAQFLAVVITLILSAPFTQTQWREDGSIPRGTAQQAGFVFLMNVYAYTWAAQYFMLLVIAAIPGLAHINDTPLTDGWKRTTPLLCIVVLAVMLLFQHGTVFLVVWLTVSRSCIAIMPMDWSWKVDEFCELFPAPPSVIEGTFVIREAKGIDHEDLGNALCITNQASSDDWDAFEAEVAALFNFPHSRTHVVAKPSEGADGTWGAEIRFHLVAPTYEVAEEVCLGVRAQLEECGKPGLYFWHTARVVKVIRGWTVNNRGNVDYHTAELRDITLTKCGHWPPLAQVGLSLSFARAMARTIRWKLVEDRLRLSEKSHIAEAGAQEDSIPQSQSTGSQPRLPLSIVQDSSKLWNGDTTQHRVRLC